MDLELVMSFLSAAKITDVSVTNFMSVSGQSTRVEDKVLTIRLSFVGALVHIAVYTS